MIKYAGLIAAALLVSATAAVSADSSMSSGTSLAPVIYTPSTIKWMPGTGPLKGAMVAALEGDMMKAGPWTVRIKVPGGVKFPAHYHNDTERVTVISGIFEVGIGPKFDASKLTPLPAGSYGVIPAHVWHYAMTQGVTVIQLSGTSPFGMETAGNGM